MATASEITHNDDFTICSICFEQFKIPRYLPCSHTFCHGCLNSYILSSCKTLEEPVLGFGCPICRVFVPAPGPLGKLKQEEWVCHFPEHEFMASLITKDVRLAHPLCDACKRDDEDQEATTLCKECMEFMCQVCTKCHRKLLATKNHEVIEISQIFTYRKPQLDRIFCDKHECRKFEMFCVDHDTPCCALCLVESHRTCQKFDTIEKAAKELCESENVQRLFNDIEELVQHFDKIMEEEKHNIEIVDEKSDKLSEEILNLKLEILSHFEKIEQLQLDEVATISKENRTKLQRSIHSFEERKSCLLFWKEVLKQVERERSKEQLLLEYHRVKEKWKEIKSLKTMMLQIDISSKIHEKALEVEKISKLIEIGVSSKAKDLTYSKSINIGNAEMICTSEFKISGKGDIFGGIHFQDGKLLVVPCGSEYCSLYNEAGAVHEIIKLMGKPWDVCLTENKLLITIFDKKEIQIINACKLKNIKSVSIKSVCKGITKSGNIFVVATENGLVKLNSDLEHMKTVPVENKTDDVVADNQGNIIYSSYTISVVTKIDHQDQIIFKYKHPNLQRPIGLALDFVGNIYVPGYNSNNIHVLSHLGMLLKIFDDIKSPTCIKFQEGSYNCFIIHKSSVSEKIVRMYRLKETK